MSADGFAYPSGKRPRDAAWAANVVLGWGASVVAPAGDGVARRLRVLEERLEAAALTRGTIHGDFGPYNVLFAGNEPPTIVDLELVRHDWLITDVAKSLAKFGRNRFGFRVNRMRRFVMAYAAAAPIDPTELTMLPDVWEFLSLRRAIVCWDRHRSTAQPHWLDEASSKLSLASSIAERADTLAALHLETGEV